MHPHQKRSIVKMADSYSDDASDNLATRWIVGVFAAIVPLLAGAMFVVYEHAYCLGGKPTRIVEYYGANALAIGAATIAVGVFVHAHFLGAGRVASISSQNY